MTITNNINTELTVKKIPTVTVFTDRCAGCEDCLVKCPTQAITMDSFS